jgi:hypothetical protein
MGAMAAMATVQLSATPKLLKIWAEHPDFLVSVVTIILGYISVVLNCLSGTSADVSCTVCKQNTLSSMDPYSRSYGSNLKTGSDQSGILRVSGSPTWNFLQLWL